jgi:Phage capsid family
MATQLNAVSSTLLPPTITGPIFAKASEESAVMRLARRVPLSVSAQTAIPVPMDIPTAGWVSEGGVKPAAQVGIGVKVMTGKKVALLVPVSQEVVMTNPAGLYTQLQQDLPTSIARAFDQAAINGKDLRSGGAGPFSDYLAQTGNSVALGTAAQNAGGLYTDIVTGAAKVVDKNYDFTGIAADPRLKIDTLLQTDTMGRPLFNDANGADVNGGTVAGFQTAFSKGVSGRYWRAGDTTQVVTINGSPTGGTFVLSSGGNSATLAYNAASSTVQTAVQGWGGIYSGVTVSGSAGGPYTFTFPNVASNVSAPAAPFAVNQTGLTGGTAATSQATISATGAGGVDSGLRGIGGDWSQCAYGVGMDISIRISNEASYYDGATWHSAFQENLVLLLVEAYYGFVVGNKDAFVAYTKGTAAF